MLVVHAQEDVLGPLGSRKHQEAHFAVHGEQALVAAVALLVDVQLKPHSPLAGRVALDARKQSRGEAQAAVPGKNREGAHVADVVRALLGAPVDTAGENTRHRLLPVGGGVEAVAVRKQRGVVERPVAGRQQELDFGSHSRTHSARRVHLQAVGAAAAQAPRARVDESEDASA